MEYLKNKWMLGFLISMVSITYFGTLLTMNTEVKMEAHNEIKVEQNIK